MEDKWRSVTVYTMNKAPKWNKLGAGYISITFMDPDQAMALLVRSDSSGSEVLLSRINPNTIYQKRQGRSIVWSEVENHVILLSFQDPEVCYKIWEDICSVQGKDPAIAHRAYEPEKKQSNEVTEAANFVPLLPCELKQLELFADLVTSALSSPITIERLVLFLENENHIRTLVQMFHTCEKLQDIEGLYHLHDIFKGILLFNKTSLFEIMFSDEYIMDVLGCLEFDPAFAQVKRHREFFTQNAKFKEVVPIRDSELKQKIRQTYRVQYIYGILLPISSVFGKNLLTNLRKFIFFNQVGTVSMLKEDSSLLSEVFTQLKDETTDDGKRHELLFFFKEFCAFTHALHPQLKKALFKALTQLEILPALKVVMNVDDLQIRSAATDIFYYLVKNFPSMIQEFIMEEVQQSDDYNHFITLVTKQMICDTDPELEGAVHIMELLRALLDPNNMLTTLDTFDRCEFLCFFYKHCMRNLTAPLFAITSEDKSEENGVVGADENKNCLNNYQTAQLLSLILEVLIFCVQHHTYYIKYYILNNDLLRRILIVMNSKHTFLILGAVRFLRRMIGLNDELYNYYIIKGNLFEPVVNAFLSNGTRYNMLNSAIIELFEYIRVENIKSLVTYIVKKYYSALGSVEYVQTFKGLKIQYEQEEDQKNQTWKNSHSTLHSEMFHRGARVLEKEEEMHFKETALESDFQDCYGKLTETEKTKGNEDKVHHPKRTSYGGFKVTSPHSASAASATSSPNSSSSVGIVDYSDEEEEKEDDNTSFRKRPCFSP
ncbi:hypothetical protein MC885_000521 [Smutsia gigantea]|nr:hypothetical protein MC885_000521 [Smutsia gigantea]